ncbi:hypothetical protein FSP39_003863 [Pinctada imbricata]|uniref:Myb/SANT-like DNA-binding domain-containing protein n=1 Tax=Pinctada imbricata TaxID=66713 RepID=A0AA88XS49_PINIB|nr:hypothetical protein FSP39_003863 [Pinctada imbricata]
MFIAEFKTFIKIGKRKIKKMVWESNSNTLNDKGYTFNPSQCESRFKTLHRGLKNVSDHNKRVVMTKKSPL